MSVSRFAKLLTFFINLFAMKLATAIKVSFSCKPEEDKQNLLAAFRSFFPFDLGKENVQITAIDTKGFNERTIELFEATLLKERHTSAFLKALVKRLSTAQKEQLTAQIDSRLHKVVHFFMRFDKGALVSGNELQLTDTGHCFHIEIVVAAFPKNQDVAKRVLTQLLTH